MSYLRFGMIAVLTMMLSWVAIPAQAQDETVTTVTPVTTSTTTTTPATATSPATSSTVVERRMIVTTVPAAKETIVVPPNYTNCFTVGGWFGDVWTPEHRVCLYKGANNGAVWVEGYWACTKYETNGNCLNWDWISARWIY